MENYQILLLVIIILGIISLIKKPKYLIQQQVFSTDNHFIIITFAPDYKIKKIHYLTPFDDLKIERNKDYKWVKKQLKNEK